MMPAKQQEAPPAGHEEEGQRTATITSHVLRALGRPADLFRLEVRRLWADHYRVNVFVGADAASVRVAHSYFLVADGAGQVLQSTPQLTRRY
jgi:hypothetical protein